jgi:plasmid stability protein
MANLTIAVDDDVLRRARIRALEQGTSVNAILRDYLVAFSAARELRARAIESLLNLAAQTESGGGTGHWSREELHER